tara:strand:+ start:10043 stop:11167 length:1125 start_codon:yes stop_codon:yes gene_type:complete
MPKSISKFKKIANKLILPVSLIALLLLFLAVFFYNSMFITVGAGHAGVKWKRFNGGTDVVNTYGEGLHVIWPWDHLEMFDVRLLTDVDSVNVLTNDGLHIDVNIAVRYRLNSDKVGLLYKNVGSKYVKILLTPEIEAHTRLLFAQFNSEDIYSYKREEIQATLKAEVIEEVEVKYNEEVGSEPFIYVQDVLIESIVLPKNLRDEIEKKLAQKHLMLSYEYRLQREKLESQRKEIEALGIRKFQNIVGDGITDRYLRWKGIDATLALAGSNNAKVVVIGAGDEGLPLILGNMGGSEPANNQSSITTERPTSLDSQNFQKILNRVTDDNTNNADLFRKNRVDDVILQSNVPNVSEDIVKPTTSDRSNRPDVKSEGK